MKHHLVPHTHIILLALCIAGVVFRLWFAGLVPQPFVYDQEEYYGYALGILKHGLHADLYRLYGYPLIISPLIALFGVTSAVPWTVFHALLDTITAVMVFWIAKRLDPRRSLPRTLMRGGNDRGGSGDDRGGSGDDNSSGAAWIAFILYLFNPYTAGYVGVLLSEIVTIFLVTLISVLLLRKKSLVPVSLLLGFLPQVRPVFIALSVTVLIVLVWSRPIKVKILSFFLFCLPFLYTITGNLIYYRQFSIVGVEPTFIRELYASLFIGRGLPFTDTKWGDWPVEAQQAWGSFTSPKDALGRKDVADRHLRITTDIIRRDPAGFVRSRIAKMGYVWEKHFVYPYVMGKPSFTIKALTYWGNIAILVMAVLGMVFARKSKKIAVYGVFVFCLYISFAHMFSTSEERFSLPAYPWVTVFAGYGIWRLLQRFRGSLLS